MNESRLILSFSAMIFSFSCMFSSSLLRKLKVFWVKLFVAVVLVLEKFSFFIMMLIILKFQVDVLDFWLLLESPYVPFGVLPPFWKEFEIVQIWHFLSQHCACFLWFFWISRSFRKLSKFPLMRNILWQFCWRYFWQRESMNFSWEEDQWFFFVLIKIKK